MIKVHYDAQKIIFKYLKVATKEYLNTKIQYLFES